MYMDYEKKEVGYFDMLNPTGDLQKEDVLKPVDKQRNNNKEE